MLWNMNIMIVFTLQGASPSLLAYYLPGEALGRGRGGGGRVRGGGSGATTDILGHGAARGARKRGAVQVLRGQLHALHVLLLLHQEVTVGQQHVEGHHGLGELHLLAGVHQGLGERFNALLLDKLADLVVVHLGAESTEEVDSLTGEAVHNHGNVVLGDAVLLEDTQGHTNAVRARGVPVELVHAAITDEGSVQGGEVVTSADNRHTGDVLVLVGARGLHVG